MKKYKLKLNKNKCKIVSIKEGFVFLGYRYKVLNKKTIIKIENSCKKRIIKRIKEVKYLYKNNYINLETFFTSINTFLNIYKVNKEASIEIARQLKLRDIGGIIIIDYIDMKSEKKKEKIIETLKEELKKDRTKTQIIGFSKLNLLELTRKHICGN